MQCPKCFHYFCWVCLHNAKGQKHYKERPQCLQEEGTLQPEELSFDLKIKHLGEHEDFINLKFCAKCPLCGAINEKRTKVNALDCNKCGEMFCYICNKAISGLEHFNSKTNYCHIESDLYADFWGWRSRVELDRIGSHDDTLQEDPKGSHGHLTYSN